MARIYAPHTFAPRRGKDYDYCDVCGLTRDLHNLKYEQHNLCCRPIPGTTLTCDLVKEHIDSDDPAQRVCSADDGTGPDDR